jgi:hypothetical protein
VLPAQRALALDQQYQISYSANQQYATEVGTAYNENLQVRVTRLSPAPATAVNGVAVTFTATPSEDGASGTFQSTGTNTVTVLSASVQVNDTSTPGYATAPTFIANGIAGSYTIRVSVDIDEANGSEVPLFFFMNNTPSAATRAFLISAGDGSLQATLVNTSYPTPFFANVFNGNNQHLAGVTVTFTAPESGPSGVFSTTGTRFATAVTNGNGFVVSPTFTANNIQGGYSVTASVSGDQTTSGEEISTSYGLRNSTTNVLDVPETVSASSGNGQQVSVSTLVPTALQVAVFDGSLAHVVGASVTFTLPATGPSGLFTNGTRTYSTTTNAEGLATAVRFTTNNEVGQISVEVTATKDGVSRTLLMSVFNGRVLTTTEVTFDPSGGSVYGQPMVVKATVKPIEGSLVPAGPVNFKRGGSLVPGCTNVTPVNGVASCQQNWIEPGTYSYSADYLGDEVSQPSSATAVNYTVTRASTATVIESSHPEFVLHGESVTLTATASPVAPGAAQAGEPTGTILFTASDGTLLNGGNPVPVVAGVASVTTSALSVGYITITAVYSGDGHFFGSSKTFVQNVFTIPEVTDDPDDTLVLVGNQATFTAAADGFPTPGVQWQVLTTEEGAVFTDINGATSPTLSVTATPAQDQYQYRAVFRNPAGFDTTEAATLTVRQPPSFTSGDSATFAVGEAGSFTVEAEGILPPTIGLTGGTLPAGVTFEPATGLLSGTPEVGSGAAYSLTFTATNGIDPDAVQAFTLHVNEAPEIISADATTFVSGTLGTFTFEASGYPAATFSTTDPLPGGLSLSAAGVLSGTPTAFGVHTFTVTATNGIGDDSTQLFTLTINEAPSIPTANIMTFTVGIANTFMVEATGFPTPTLGLTGTLPTGLTFDPATGVLSGTAADGTGGTYPLTFTATNSVTTFEQPFTLTVNESPELTSANAATFVLGEAGSFNVTASGHPNMSFSVTSGILPNGVTLSGAGLLSGTPGVGTAGTYLLTITASNGVAPDAAQSFTLSVVPPEVIAPDDIAVSNDLDQAGAIVTYPAPTAIGNVGTITCTPASGSFFALGETTVTCNATSGLSDTFTITVLDTQLPAISAPANISVENTTGQAGAIVTYTTPVPSDNAPGVTAACLPASGTFFGLGTTTVTCTARDGAGNTTTAKFTVTVIPTTAYLINVLQDSTATLVTHATTEKALLATLAKVEMYVKAGNPMLAYMTMLQFVVQVDQFADARRITPAAAGQLLTQAQTLTRSIL